ncbi:hypothetical protein ACFLZM_07750 [Thermodesulfobacteriota bacterium]
MFKPLTKEQIEKQVIKDLSGDDKDFNADDHKEAIDRITKSRIKDQEELKNQYDGRNHYKKMAKDNKIDLKTGKQIKDDKKDKNKDDKKTTSNDDKYVTKEDLDKREKRIQHRQGYLQLSDDEYNTIDAIAKAKKISFEEAIEKDPVAKNYVENTDALNRVAGAINNPSTRTNANKPKSEEEKTAEELSDGLPKGYKASEDKK